MSDTPTEKTLDHTYDGIHEFDNPTPGWWVWIFILTVIFAIGYFVWYDVGMPDRTLNAEYATAKAIVTKKKLAKLGELKLDEASLLRYMHSQDHLDAGREVFKANCTSCHGPDGQGQIGPNLTADIYKHVKKLEDIPAVIMAGANNGAMPSWKNRLDPTDIALVASYVASLRGKNLPGYVLPGRVPIPPWPAYTPAATATAPAK